MKNYRQLIKELPSKSVTIAFGSFNIPTAHHESYVKVVKKIAESKSADHIIFTSDKKSLLSERKDHYLNLLFPHTKFVHNEGTVPFIVESLTKKYKSIIVVVSEEKRQEYSRYLKEFNNVSIITVDEKDPDTESAKIKSLITKGAYSLFKESLPSQVRDIDGKLLMNELRHGLGLDPIKEQVKLTVSELREKYYKGDIYHIGEVVESAGVEYEIMDRGSNYLTLIDENGKLCKKWIQDVSIVEEKKGLWANIHAKQKRIKNGSGEHMRKPGSKGAPTDKDFKDSQVKESTLTQMIDPQVTFKGYTTKNCHHADDIPSAWKNTIEYYGEVDPIAVLNALKHTDNYLNVHNHAAPMDHKDLEKWRDSHNKARDILHRIGQFMDHEEYWYHAENLLMKSVPVRVTTTESIDSRVTVDPKSGYNAAKDVMRYKDFKKLLKMNRGEVKEARAMDDYTKTAGAPDTYEKDTFVATPATSQAIKNLETLDAPHTKVGHTLGANDDDHLRRLKVRYHTESVLNPHDPHGDYKEKKKALYDLQKDPHTHKDPDLKQAIIQRHADLDREYRKHTVTEDVYTSEYKIKTFVDPVTGQTKTRKIRPHRIDFDASKANSAPSQNDKNGDVREASDGQQFVVPSEPELIKKAKGKKGPEIPADKLGGGNTNKGFDAFFNEIKAIKAQRNK